jgi:hypothetical protein
VGFEDMAARVGVIIIDQVFVNAKSKKLTTLHPWKE